MVAALLQHAAQLFESPAELQEVSQSNVSTTQHLHLPASKHLNAPFALLCALDLYLHTSQSIKTLAKLKPEYDVSAVTDQLVLTHMLQHRSECTTVYHMCTTSQNSQHPCHGSRQLLYTQTPTYLLRLNQALLDRNML